ncbi:MULTISPECIES: hypothetical protein [Pseudomonas chlororaphis group]|uniref:hypothetical protein n=1 Tax=Pseudomonas chlororaphis group TaxID=136842 RepID=UPI0020969B9C|nr:MULTISPECIES: hypothetical protein [Pseudomonas chlororaphis group]MCO7575365.1 hypothetical protein [Pseudomonas protegens]MCO7582532.1 hypothetical protein [Pseudomonas chlororaphis]MCO7599289.1 hypothetical protein [Pseudomonas chlororaphis]
MKNMALIEWQYLLAVLDSSDEGIDEHYCHLISTANEMLRLGLVDRKEWHSQIQQAGDWLVAAIELEQAGK